MKQTIVCGRCQSKIDIEEGMRVLTCISPLHKSYFGHQIVVDEKSDKGAAILQHIERKPRIVHK